MQGHCLQVYVRLECLVWYCLQRAWYVNVVEVAVVEAVGTHAGKIGRQFHVVQVVTCTQAAAWKRCHTVRNRYAGERVAVAEVFAAIECSESIGQDEVFHTCRIESTAADGGERWRQDDGLYLPAVVECIIRDFCYIESADVESYEVWHLAYLIPVVFVDSARSDGERVDLCVCADFRQCIGHNYISKFTVVNTRYGHVADGLPVVGYHTLALDIVGYDILLERSGRYIHFQSLVVRTVAGEFASYRWRGCTFEADGVVRPVRECIAVNLLDRCRQGHLLHIGIAVEGIFLDVAHRLRQHNLGGFVLIVVV